MRLYLLRHGESEPSGSDNERRLSVKGKKEIQLLAKAIAPLHLKLDQIFHSEKRRAQQTAELILPAIEFQGEMTVRSELDPTHPLVPISEEVYTWNSNTLLVGHLPFMSKLVSLLTTGNDAEHIVDFKPGTMVCLEQIAIRRWIICWVLSPDLLSN